MQSRTLRYEKYGRDKFSFFFLFYLSFFLFRIYRRYRGRVRENRPVYFFKVPASKALPRFQRFFSFSRWNNASQYFYDIILEMYPLPFLKLNGYLEDRYINSQGLHWPRRLSIFLLVFHMELQVPMHIDGTYRVSMGLEIRFSSHETNRSEWHVKTERKEYRN